MVNARRKISINLLFNIVWIMKPQQYQIIKQNYRIPPPNSTRKRSNIYFINIKNIE